MPSSRRNRRQEIRKRRRQARRSLQQFMLDDDLDLLEDDGAEPLYELAPRRYGWSDGRLRSLVLVRTTGG
jgi:hypothetical protein